MDEAEAIRVTNYQRGYATERRAVALLKKRGYPHKYIARTAGSHSKIDVLAIDPENKRIFVAQCKRSKGGSFPDVQLPADGAYYVEFRVLNWLDREGFVELDGDGNVVEESDSTI